MDLDVPVPPAPAPPPTVRRRWPVLMIGVLLLVAAGGVGFGLGRASGPDKHRAAPSSAAASSSTSSGFAIAGTMKAAGCNTGGYSDIREGAQVEITNQSSNVLAITTLEDATGYCAFRFYVSGVPSGERLYGVNIGNSNRGVIWKTEKEARSESFDLVLGN